MWYRNVRPWDDPRRIGTHPGGNEIDKQRLLFRWLGPIHRQNCRHRVYCGQQWGLHSMGWPCATTGQRNSAKHWTWPSDLDCRTFLLVWSLSGDLCLCGKSDLSGWTELQKDRPHPPRCHALWQMCSSLERRVWWNYEMLHRIWVMFRGIVVR